MEKAELRGLKHSGEKRWANNLLQSKRFDSDAADCPTGSKTGEKIAFEQTPKARALGNRDLQDGSAENELASAANVKHVFQIWNRYTWNVTKPGAYSLTFAGLLR